MKTNFKRILAVLISLALVFSVCTMGLTVSAAEENTDGYYVLADGTDCGWVNDGNAVKKGVYDGSSFGYVTNRVTPQFVKTGAHIWLGTKNYTDAGVNAADVKTISIYLNNDMDTTLTYRLVRSTEDATYGAENQYWNLSGGYAYLLDIYGYVLPVYVDGGWLTVPAGFEGYVIYDVPTFAAASKLEATNFTAMAFDIKNTKEMLAQAWYFGEVAVATMSAEELIAYHNNGEAPQYFLLGDGINMHTEHPNVFDTRNTWGYADLTKEFVTINGGKLDGNIKAPFYGWTAKTDVLGALDTAVGFSFYLNVNTETSVSIAPCINGQQNNLIDGTIYLVGFDGSVKVITDTERDGLAIVTGNFDGMVYVFPDEIETTWGSTTYEDWKAKGFTGINFYCRKSSADEEGTSIIFDNIALLYDQEKIVDDFYMHASTVINDGSNIPIYYNSANYTPSLINTPDTDGDAIQITSVESLDGTKPNQYFTFPINATVSEPERVKTLSFKLKTPNFQNKGSIESLTLRFNGENGGHYRGNVTLVNFDGTVTTIENASGSANTEIKAPEYFDGTVILDLTGDVIYYNSELMTFAEFMALKDNKITSIFTWMGLRYRSYYEQHIIFDDFRLGYATASDLEDTIAYPDLYNRSYELNSGLGNWNHTASAGNFVSVTTVKGAGVQGSNTYAFEYLPKADKTETAADIGVLGSGGFADLPVDLDISEATALSYWVSVPDLPEGGWYNFTFGIGPNGNDYRRDVVSATAYLVDDDGYLVKTIPHVTDTATSIRIDEPFTGRIFLVLDENAKIKDYTDKNWYSWTEYVNIEATPFNRIGHYLIRSSAEVNEEYPLYLDDYRIHFYDGQYYNLLSELDYLAFEEQFAQEEAKEQAKVVFAADDLNSAKFTDTTVVDNGDGTTTTTNLFDREVVDMGEYGSAIHYKRVEGLTMGAKDAFYNTEHGLTKAELAEKEALVMWMSIPKTAPGYGTQTRINQGGHHIWSSIITANTLTGEMNYIEAYDRSFTLEPGFEGYVIIPLENAVVKTTGWGSATPVAWSEYIAQYGFTSYQFYYNEQKNLDWYQGEIKLVDDIQSFLIEAGATTVAGDLNYDQESNILDLIRAKKYAAGAATQIAYQNLDVDENGTLDIAADIVGMKKLLLGEDHVAEEVIEHAQYGVHMFHGEIGDWNNEFAHLALEEEVLNTYITSDLYEIALAREQGASVWLYVGGTAKATDAYKQKMTDLVARIKELKLWNTVVGVFYEEPSTTDEEFIELSKFFDELVGKRQLACLSSAQIASATPARYQYITDIGYDNYHIDLAGHRTTIENIRKNTGLTDAPLWFFPQVFGNEDEATMIAELEMYETLIAEQENFGGIMFYTWVSWSDDTPGFKEIVNDNEYYDLADKVVQMSADIIAKQ